MLRTPPGSDSFELSLFGCGVGESAALHLGHGEWIIVDSCRINKRDEPLPLIYLRECGIDPASAVKLIVLTHWHDDHVDGASSIVQACPKARIALSAAFVADEFAQILGLYGLGDRIVDRRTSGVRELGSVMSISEQRIESGAIPNTGFAVIPAQADQRLYRRAECELFALAPSPGSIHVARNELKSLLADLLSTPDQSRVLIASGRNDYSIALWLRWGDLRVLLGGDLEVNADNGRGWGAVLTCHQFPDKKAQVVKIAHHGSPNGDDPRVWEHLIEPNAHALLTSYSRGVRPLPDETDLARIKQRAANVYYTSLPPRASVRRDRTVEKTIQTVARRRRTLGREPGHVRLRWTQGAASPTLDCSGTAKSVG
jgi:beta-lactamase superfamily II metal-dependent hydrolase